MASELAHTKHAKQTDKARKPYINHILAVVDGVEGDITQSVAYLHDVVEDTDMTFEALKSLGFSDEIVDAVNAITKREGEEYREYVQRVKANEHARLVKISDLKHNMDLSRLINVTEKDHERIKKYNWALNELRSV